jgi:hypothetical protein
MNETVNELVYHTFKMNAAFSFFIYTRILCCLCVHYTAVCFAEATKKWCSCSEFEGVSYRDIHLQQKLVRRGGLSKGFKKNVFTNEAFTVSVICQYHDKKVYPEKTAVNCSVELIYLGKKQCL